MRKLYIVPSLLLAAPALLAQRFPEVEPNGSSATAQPVVMGTQVDCTLVAGEQDWFSFTTAGGQVRMFATPTPGTATLDTQLELWDGAGTAVIAFNDDCRSGLASDITINLAAGTYLVKIDGFSATTAGSYAFELGELAAKPFTASEVEPNDTVATPQVVALPAQIDGNLSGAADQDWYQITLATQSGVYIQTTEGTTPWVSQHRVEFYDAAGVLVPTGTLGGNATDSSGTTYRTSNIRCWPAGTYHVVVKNRSTAPTINPNPTGNYRLEIEVLPMHTGAIVAEAAEPNNTVATATPIGFGDRGTGNITISTGADSSDWWGPITLPTAAVVMYQTTQSGASPLLDSTINIRNFDPVTGILGAPTASTIGNILTTTSHARGTFQFNLTPGTYYLEVLSPGTAASQAGDYTLEVSQIIAAPYVAASYAFATVNTTCLGSNATRPTITQETTRELPCLGTSFFRKVGSMQPGSAFFLMQGFALQGNSIINSQPFDLGPLGAPNCLVHVRPDFTPLYIANAAGELEILFSVPGTIALRGLPIFEQAAVLDLPANALGITVSNWARMILGERSY